MTASHVLGKPEPAAKAASPTDHVYAIIRIDSFLGDDIPLEHKVTVKKIMRDADEAEREVERLNRLQKDGGVRYFAQITRIEKEPPPENAPETDDEKPPANSEARG